ncbi:hypothetical protein PILCRDRAFT_589372 [Piloderma croceum F 1598]|uniref:Uncharacterized protein n=1 Tax=Piloderma croceum (strain F 1598) TaxID=765440 RepID=A0A0C3BMD3_PILCF|nr:hypothetical protein PILCRDRAFT_589372 [Piloderma croceum F 1598]
MPSSRFTIAAVTETLTLLMNTPMVPPPEENAGGLEVQLTEMPPQSRRRGVSFSDIYGQHKHILSNVIVRRYVLLTK